jgi:hypothetical protein
MTPDDAARALDVKLRPHRWYLSIGVGSNKNGDAALYVYVKSRRHKELEALSNGWMGYEVIIRPVGSIRPAADHMKTPAENCSHA